MLASVWKQTKLKLHVSNVRCSRIKRANRAHTNKTLLSLHTYMYATSGPHERRNVERAESWNVAEDVMLVLWYGVGALISRFCSTMTLRNHDKGSGEWSISAHKGIYDLEPCTAKFAC